MNSVATLTVSKKETIRFHQNMDLNVAIKLPSLIFETLKTLEIGKITDTKIRTF